ncbi:unnamed protein product [Cladocopium goreaui]|uniref:Cyclic nucleotide-binding domain-containing protein n=1 Tax=Cladocopium goreaui TaxID=2562237 RepID=A0A9P1BYF5_9DINO|nr:unnamed protein product [Cladocopium goreaui]
MALDLDEAQCRNALYKLPCEQRMAAAERHPHWAQMTWQEKLRAAKGAVAASPSDHQPPIESAQSMPELSVRRRVTAVTPPDALAEQRSLEARVASHRSHALHNAPLAVLGAAGAMLATAQHAGPNAAQQEWLKLIFETSDGLKVAMGHHREELLRAVIRAMRLQPVQANETIIQQGQPAGQRMYIVAEGIFDVLVQRSDGRSVAVCQQGPGSVFDSAWLTNGGATRVAPPSATVIARSRGQLWILEKRVWEQALRAPVESKSIGLVGGVMLLINNLAGPTIVSMPALAQEAGWFSLFLVQAVVAGFSSLCGLMLIEAMRCIPGNHHFEQTIEFTNLASFYLPHQLYVGTMICYHINSILNLMSLIIQSGQVMDYIMLNVYGCAPGLQLGLRAAYVCGTQTDSVTPFGDRLVLSSSMLAVALICAPFAVKNLDDNAIWIALLLLEPAFPRNALPSVTTSQSSLIGTVLFNFAFTSALPSWVNEKKSDVPVGVTFWTTMSFVVVLYSLVGIIGGMAYSPFYDTNENLFSKLNASGSRIGQITVAAYPMLQNVTSIPVLAILIRCNLIQGGVPSSAATFIAVALPWLMSIPFYTGSGFDTIAELGGLATSSVINFMIPLMMYVVAVGRKKEREELLSQSLPDEKDAAWPRVGISAAAMSWQQVATRIYRAHFSYDPVADPFGGAAEVFFGATWDVMDVEVPVPAPQKLLFTISQARMLGGCTSYYQKVLPLSYSLIAVAPRSQSGSQELTHEYQSMFEGTGGHSVCLPCLRTVVAGIDGMARCERPSSKQLDDKDGGPQNRLVPAKAWPTALPTASSMQADLVGELKEMESWGSMMFSLSTEPPFDGVLAVSEMPAVPRWGTHGVPIIGRSTRNGGFDWEKWEKPWSC